MPDTEQQTMLRVGEELISPLHPLYDGLRIEGPPTAAYLSDCHLVWVVTRYRDARAILTDPTVCRDARRAAELFTHKTGVVRPVIGAALSRHMLNADPPDHTRLRALVSKAFTSRRVQQLRPAVERITDELLNTIASQDEADLMADFAVPLTIGVICELLGVPVEEREHVRSSWERQAQLLSPQSAEKLCEEQSTYLTKLLGSKREHPAEDLLTGLTQASDEGDRLTEDELVAMTHLLLMAGFETTMNLIGNAVVALLLHPDQLALVRTDPNLLASALEELVRYGSPVCASMLRFTTAPVQLGDVTIPAGEYVLVSNYVANHDPERFVNPDRLDFTRKTEGHLGYGHGAHYCIGAPLARLEAQIAISRLLVRFPGLTLAVAPEKLQWLPFTFLRALASLPVTVGTESR